MSPYFDCALEQDHGWEEVYCYVLATFALNKPFQLKYRGFLYCNNFIITYLLNFNQQIQFLNDS